MKPDPTPEEIKARFESLPEDMQAAVTSDSVIEHIKQIAEKYSLRIDKTDRLIQEVALIMLGFQKGNEFVQNLQRQLEVTRETAESIAVDVDSKVFDSIRDSLKSVQLDSHGSLHHDEDHGNSPVRDSLIKDIERGAQIPVESFSSTSDYSFSGFSNAGDAALSGEAWTPTQHDVYAPQVAVEQQVAATPYQVHISQEEKIDPTKSFQDHLQKKIEIVKEQVANDPYREPIE